MEMDKNTHELIRKNIGLENALVKWRQFCKNLSFHPETFKARWNIDLDIPEANIFDDTGNHKIVISVAETTIECKFDYVCDGSLLRFGYLAPKAGDEYEFVESTRLHIDIQGNILDKQGGTPTSHCLQVPESVDSVFFGECLKALNKSWEGLLQE